MSQGLLVHRETCRLCGHTGVDKAVALTPTPPANAFVAKDQLGVSQPVFPLDLYFCSNCGHVQLLDIVDPAHLFENYVYVSGTSPAFVRHFQDYASDVRKLARPKIPKVLDIGSNDGTLLRAFKELGCEVLGVDPAVEIAANASASGIPTVAAFFDRALAAQILSDHGKRDIITANNVFAHADDLAGIAMGIADLLSDQGIFVFEVSYLGDVVTKGLFDTIYHEHVAYHAVTPLIGFFERHGLKLIDALHVDTHGGSLRGIVAKADADWVVSDNVRAWTDREAEQGLNRIETFRTFEHAINAQRDALTELLNGLKAEGRTVAGFGAPAKATTLMYHFGIGPETIDFIVDDSPLKQGLFTPGTHIPVLGSDALYDRKPDYAVILAWNFAEPIVNNHRQYLEQGGKFIQPIPELKVIGS